jgi:creatinine amidohydrolase
MAAAEAGNTWPLGELMQVLRRDGVRAAAPNGVLGDPRGATPEIGTAVLDSLTDFLAAKIPDLEHS